MRNELEGAFGGAEIGKRERGVGGNHANEPHVREIKPLRDHLRAHQDAHVAATEPFERVVEMRGGLHRVAVNAQQRFAFDKARERAREFLFDALGAEAKHRHRLAAIGALLREHLLGETVVAAHVSTSNFACAIDVTDHAGVAFGAGEHPVAAGVGAGDVVCVAAPVEEKQDLAAVGERDAHRVAQGRADQARALLVHESAFGAEVDDRDLRNVEAGRPLREAMQR